jgi:hypothetical protein
MTAADLLSGLIVATTNRYDAVATFDRKVANKLESFGLAEHF